MSLDYGRSPSGERVYDENPRDSGERASTAAVLTEKGVEAEFSYTGSMTPELFVFYLEMHVLKLLVGGKVLVMDNLPSHRANIVEEFLNKHKVLYVYLPPYSPELNPIEEAFSKIKHFIRKQKPRTLQALYEARKKAISLVTEDDVIGYINHSYEFL
jgi:transposase